MANENDTVVFDVDHLSDREQRAAIALRDMLSKIGAIGGVALYFIAEDRNGVRGQTIGMSTAIQNSHPMAEVVSILVHHFGDLIDDEIKRALAAARTEPTEIV